ncbi:MAG: glycosyltransferase, partial [Actinomycetota bacterium]
MSAEVTADFPRVRVVILSFDGGDMTLDCLESLARTEWPADRLEVVMVDNGSLDNISLRVAERFPSVRILEPLANLGFAGGCNFGIQAPAVDGVEPDFIALVNNDATVAPSWLAPLVETIRSATDIGAVSAKMVFAPRFTGFEYWVESAGPMPDNEPPGVCITQVRIGGERDYVRFVTDESVYASMPIEPESDDELRRWTKTAGN